MKKSVRIIFSILCCVCSVLICASAPNKSNTIYNEQEDAVQALCGGYGYGAYGACIQSPGAQAGAYVYAGTGLPYLAPGTPVIIPDSLQVLFVNHIGRHGARYLSSDKFSSKVENELGRAGELSFAGKRVEKLCQVTDSLSVGHWGALDAVGKSEQSAIGQRFAERYNGLLTSNDSIIGFSSYIPRCVMSMDEMTHGVVWVNRDIEMSTGSGKRFSPLLRAFDVDEHFRAYQKQDDWHKAYDAFYDSVCPTAVALRLTSQGSRFLQHLCRELIAQGVEPAGGPLEVALADTLSGVWPPEWEVEAGMSKQRAQEVAFALYRIVGGTQSLFMTENVGEDVYTGWQNYFTEQEYAHLWECANLKHYLEWTTTAYGDTPSRMAVPLLRELLNTMSAAAEPGYDGPAAIVRFGHAETLMPLYALMQLPGCFYVTDNLADVSAHWQDYDVVPMAANLQMVLTRSKVTGIEYLLMYRNEQLISVPERWSVAKARLEGYCQPSAE